MNEYDVIVVGAGAAGVGLGCMLRDIGVENLLILDRSAIGASFKAWPEEMRFITPSFPTNSAGFLDLNSIAVGTSPAYSLQVEHPSGKQYALYLNAVAEHNELPVRTGIDVLSITESFPGFSVSTSKGSIKTRFVIWAAGEFQYPRLDVFPGSELCVHTSQVRSWQDIDGEEVFIIGGYESGIDAAIHLARHGVSVTVLERADDAAWETSNSDPSYSLSTFTNQRLKHSRIAPMVTLGSGADVAEVKRNKNGYELICATGHSFHSKTQPLLATGFHGSTSLIAELFDYREDGFPLLNDRDESVITPGLFLAGPMVRHEQHVFCFIYKFRQRFGVVAGTIAEQLDLPLDRLELYRQWGMYLDDLSCCGSECVC